MKYDQIGKYYLELVKALTYRATASDEFTASDLTAPLVVLQVDIKSLWLDVVRRKNPTIVARLCTAIELTEDAHASVASGPALLEQALENWNELYNSMRNFGFDNTPEELVQQFMLLRGMTLVNIACVQILKGDTPLALAQFKRARNFFELAANCADMKGNLFQQADQKVFGAVERHATENGDATNDPAANAYGYGIAVVGFLPILTSYVLNECGLGYRDLAEFNVQRAELCKLANTLNDHVVSMIQVCEIID